MLWDTPYVVLSSCPFVDVAASFDVDEKPHNDEEELKKETPEEHQDKVQHVKHEDTMDAMDAMDTKDMEDADMEDAEDHVHNMDGSFVVADGAALFGN